MKLANMSGQIEFNELRLSRSGVSEALIDIAGKRPSQTSGPLKITRSRQLVDGYHRLVEAILSGKTSLPYIFAKSDNYPIVGGWFEISQTMLQGLEVLIDGMDDDQLHNLASLPTIAESIKHFIMNLIQQRLA